MFKKKKEERRRKKKKEEERRRKKKEEESVKREKKKGPGPDECLHVHMFGATKKKKRRIENSLEMNRTKRGKWFNSIFFI